MTHGLGLALPAVIVIHTIPIGGIKAIMRSERSMSSGFWTGRGLFSALFHGKQGVEIELPKCVHFHVIRSMFPLMTTVSHFGKLAHDGVTLRVTAGHRVGDEVDTRLSLKHRAIEDRLHGTLLTACPALDATTGGDAMTYNRLEAKPIAGEHCRFCGDAEVMSQG